MKDSPRTFNALAERSYVVVQNEATQKQSKAIAGNERMQLRCGASPFADHAY